MIIVRVKRDDIYIAELETEIKDFMEEVRDLVEFVKTYKKEG
jgi:hypothetical protein